MGLCVCVVMCVCVCASFEMQLFVPVFIGSAGTNDLFVIVLQ
jgi:hypothetical protein